MWKKTEVEYYRSREGVLFILWSLFREQAEQVTLYVPTALFSVFKAFRLLLVVSFFSHFWRWKFWFRYNYKVCPYKEATQEEGYSTTRLGYVSIATFLHIFNLAGSFLYLQLIFLSTINAKQITHCVWHMGDKISFLTTLLWMDMTMEVYSLEDVLS